jgi:hypothetical protein
MKIESKINGKIAKIELTPKEIESALSICDLQGMEEVIVMKKHNGSALFFTEQRNANQCQERHKFDYAFTLSKKDLLENSKKGNIIKGQGQNKKSNG